MPRVKRGVSAHKRHKKILKLAKGYRGSKSKLFKVAKQQVMKSGQYAYIHRRLKKREFRKLWIARINAAARINGTTYSRMVHGLKAAGVEINRKMLAEIAINDAQGFTKLADLAKEALAVQV
jgi:large subunit ribosomal protein L20